jgi:hypothetical protein
MQLIRQLLKSNKKATLRIINSAIVARDCALDWGQITRRLRAADCESLPHAVKMAAVVYICLEEADVWLTVFQGFCPRNDVAGRQLLFPPFMASLRFDNFGSVREAIPMKLMSFSKPDDSWQR